MSNRREFLIHGCQAAVAACIAATVFSSLLEGCKTAELAGLSIQENEISFLLSSFGSKKIIVISDKRLKDDVAVIKKSDGTYFAMKMQCTHQMNPIQYTGNGFYCPSHGSTFDMEGKPTAAPAMRPLKRYTTSVNGSNLIVKIA